MLHIWMRETFSSLWMRNCTYEWKSTRECVSGTFQRQNEGAETRSLPRSGLVCCSVLQCVARTLNKGAETRWLPCYRVSTRCQELSAKEPRLSTKEPDISAKQPYLSTIEPSKGAHSLNNATQPPCKTTTHPPSTHPTHTHAHTYLSLRSTIERERACQRDRERGSRREADRDR